MNPFEDLIPNKKPTGQNPFLGLAPQPTQQKVPIGTKIQKGLDIVFGGGKVGEAIGTEIAKFRASPEERQFIEEGPTRGQVFGSALQSGALFAPVGRVASGVTSALGRTGLKTGVSALGKITAGALEGLAFDTALKFQEGKTGVDTLRPGFGTAIGGAIPAVGVGLNVAGRTLKNVAPKLLSYTSDVPEKAFETMIQRRQNVVPRLGQATPQTALKNTQEAVRDLRGILTKDWQEGVVGIADEFTGKRLGLSDKSVSRLADLSNDFGFKIPQNPKNASVVEWVNTLKSINELPKLTLTVSPKGNAVRTFKKDLQNLVIDTFGGKKGSVANLYKNYSSKKEVFDAANEIVRAYSTGKPIQQSTALNRLQTLFNENKPAYLEAIIDLEQATGRDLLSEITASKFAPKLPVGSSPVSATTGILAPTGILDKAIKLLLAPLSSPRSAGFIARQISKLGKTGTIQGPGDRLLQTKLGQKIESNVTDFIKNPKLGLSIEDVSKGSDDLIREARKYKSAEEFVKLPKIKTDQADYLTNIFSKVKNAEIYAKEGKRKFVLRDVENITPDFTEVPASMRSSSDFRTVKDFIVKFKDGTIDRYRNPVFEISEETKSQLTDIWKKANKK